MARFALIFPSHGKVEKSTPNVGGVQWPQRVLYVYKWSDFIVTIFNVSIRWPVSLPLETAAQKRNAAFVSVCACALRSLERGVRAHKKGARCTCERIVMQRNRFSNPFLVVSS